MMFALMICMVAGRLLAQPSATAPGGGKGAGPRIRPISVVSISVTNHTDIDRLVQSGFDVDQVRGSQVILYADTDELSALQSQGWQMSVQPPTTATPSAAVLQPLGEYHDYTNMTALLEFYATNCPSLCRLQSIGKSVQGRELWVLKITRHPEVAAGKPKFNYISTMHANEPLGTETCLYLIDRLLTGYATNDVRIVNLVNNIEIWILPMMNPDGREANPPQRYNANGYDLNRSFPEGSDQDIGNLLYGPLLNTNGLQPEVGEVMAWTAGHRFVLSANFHTGDLVVNYPYDNDNMGSVFSPSPDEALMEAISRTYSSNDVPMWNSPYFADGIVNGAAWYAISGGMQDWNYRYAGCFDTTIEISDDQWPDPPASEIPTYWSQNEESMLAYMEWVLKGVRGVIRDARTGLPVAAAVRVEGYPHQIFSNPQVGDYHRILLPGSYTLWFDAPGYVPQRIPNVCVQNGDATRLDVALQPLSRRFAVKINFQPAGGVVPTGYLTDSGAAFGARGNNYSYGWETNLASTNVIARGAGRSQDIRYDTFCQMQASGNHTWAISVPNGFYSVHIAAGDPASTNGAYGITAEGVPLLEGFPTSSNWWVEGIGAVWVSDGKLTLSSAAGATNNSLDYVEISAPEPPAWDSWWAECLSWPNSGNQHGFHDRAGFGPGFDSSHFNTSWHLSPAIVHTNNTDYFSCSFQRDPSATNLIFRIQTSESLSAGSSWTDLACCTNGCGWSGCGNIRETMVSPGCVVVTVLDFRPVSPGANRFIRMCVTRP
jgi:carboxypeptidase D